MFLTTPSRTSPSSSWLTSSVRCSARASSRMARRDTTMLPRGRSILRMAKGCSLPISGPTSRTGRMSTCEPGRKALAPPRSTVKPPFTRPTMEPITGCCSANTPSRRVQASSRLAFSRLMTASPRAFSRRSRKTSTLSPIFRVGLPASSTPNSLIRMRPSVFRPTSMMAKSFSMPTTMPLMTVPSAKSPPAPPMDSSSRAAKSSRLGFRLRSSAIFRNSLLVADRGQAAGCRRSPGGPWVSVGFERPRPFEWSALGLASGGFPPAARRLDDTAGRIEGRVYSHFGGVEQDRVGGGDHRRVGPGGVAGVPGADIGEDFLVGDGLTLTDQLLPAAPGPGFGGGRDIQFGRRVRGDDRADVAAVDHRAGLLGREGPLEVPQHLADGGVDGHPAGGLAGGAGAGSGGLPFGGIQRPGGGGGGGLVAEIAPFSQNPHADRPIEQAGIQHRIAIETAQPNADR